MHSYNTVDLQKVSRLSSTLHQRSTRKLQTKVVCRISRLAATKAGRLHASNIDLNNFTKNNF